VETVKNISDEEIAGEAKSGSNLALEELARRFTRPVYVLCFRILNHSEDAKDACQEVFLKLVHQLLEYSPERPFAPLT